MKKHLIITILAAFALGTAAVSAFDQPAVQQLQAKDHIVIFGDSTTAAGIRTAGYVQLLILAMNEQMPGVKVSAICKNTRATNSLLGPGGWILGSKFQALQQPEQPPTISLIILGLNDSKAGAAGVEPYTKNLREAVGLLRERKQTVILTTPSTWGGLTQTKPYAEAAHVLATELKCPLIDLYAVQTELISAHTKDGNLDPAFCPTWDGVHLSAVGNTLWAGTILKAFGLKPEWKKYQLQTAVTEVGVLYRSDLVKSCVWSIDHRLGHALSIDTEICDVGRDPRLASTASYEEGNQNGEVCFHISHRTSTLSLSLPVRGQGVGEQRVVGRFCLIAVPGVQPVVSL